MKDRLIGAACATTACFVALAALALVCRGEVQVLLLLLPGVAFVAALLTITRMKRLSSLPVNNIAFGAAAGFSLAVPFAGVIAMAGEYVKSGWILLPVVLLPATAAFTGGSIGSMAKKEVSIEFLGRIYFYGALIILCWFVLRVTRPEWFGAK